MGRYVDDKNVFSSTKKRPWNFCFFCLKIDFFPIQNPHIWTAVDYSPMTSGAGPGWGCQCIDLRQLWIWWGRSDPWLVESYHVTWILASHWLLRLWLRLWWPGSWLWQWQELVVTSTHTGQSVTPYRYTRRLVQWRKWLFRSLTINTRLICHSTCCLPFLTHLTWWTFLLEQWDFYQLNSLFNQPVLVGGNIDI